MNPLLKTFLSAVLRSALTGGGAWFVQKGIINDGQAEEMIAGLILWILTLAWSLYEKYQSKLEFFTVAAMPRGTTLEDTKESIARGCVASAGTGAGDVPQLVDTNAESVKPRLDA